MRGGDRMSDGGGGDRKTARASFYMPVCVVVCWRWLVGL